MPRTVKRVSVGDRIRIKSTGQTGTVILTSGAEATVKWDDNTLATGKQNLLWMCDKLDQSTREEKRK